MTDRSRSGRRHRLATLPTAALAVACLSPVFVGASSAGAPTARPEEPRLTTAHPAGVDAAYSFLDQMMDLQATGTTPRLVQSFLGGPVGRHHFTDSETYDDAVMIDAYLSEGTSDGLTRATAIGQALVGVQADDPAADGRVREAYSPGPLSGPHPVRITGATSDVGNMAWVGMALARLSVSTGDAGFLGAAEAVGTWIATHCRDRRGAGGFTGGETASGAAIRWKSTEHNLDLVGLYGMLAELTSAPQWTQDAAWARGFVDAMWDPASDHFDVGTLDDGVTPNLAEEPEDVNSWSYLVLGDPTYAASVDWDVDNLSASHKGFHGVSFCEGHRNGVWFEGTAHLADALELRSQPGDVALAQQYLADIALAQTRGPHTDGLGIIAASNRLSDCDGDFYFSSLHTGATGWYVLASLGVDPLRLES